MTQFEELEALIKKTNLELIEPVKDSKVVNINYLKLKEKCDEHYHKEIEPTETEYLCPYCPIAKALEAYVAQDN